MVHIFKNYKLNVCLISFFLIFSSFKAFGDYLDGSFEIGRVASRSHKPSLTKLNDGNVVVAYRDYNDETVVIHVKILSPSGVEINSFCLSEKNFPSATNHDFFVHVVPLSNGNFVLLSQAYLQVFDSLGKALEDKREFNLGNMEATPLLNDGFIVAGSDLEDKLNISAQIFDSFGKMRDRVRVNRSTAGYPITKSLVTLKNGDVVVVWQNKAGVYGQILDEFGKTIGNEFIIGCSGDNSKRACDPHVAPFRDGSGFFVVYKVCRSSSSASVFDGIWGQKFSHNGSKLGDKFLILEESAKVGQYKHLFGFKSIRGASFEDDRFIILYYNYDNLSADNILGQYIDNEGQKIGNSFSLDANCYYYQSAVVETLDNGGFIIVWDCNCIDHMRKLSFSEPKYLVYGKAYLDPVVTTSKSSYNSCIESLISADGIKVLTVAGDIRGGGGLEDAFYIYWKCEDNNDGMETSYIIRGGEPEIDFLDNGFMAAWECENSSKNYLVHGYPVVTASKSVINYNSCGEPVIVDDGIDVVSMNSGTIKSARVKFSPNFNPAEDFLEIDFMHNISHRYDAKSGELTLTSLSATVDDFVSALRSVRYVNKVCSYERDMFLFFEVSDGSRSSNLAPIKINIVKQFSQPR